MRYRTDQLGNIIKGLSALCVAMVLGGLTAGAQVSDAWVGRWWLGMLEEASLPLNITFEKEGNEATKPVLYSPMQSSEAILPSDWSFSADTLRIQIKSLNAKLSLKYNSEDTSFSGKFKQGLLVADIRFRRSEGMYKLIRPQMPHAPFPYREKQYVLRHKDSRGEEIAVGVTLTLPGKDESSAKSPCVLLVSGSGMQNRDEELLGHKPFWVIADHLARNGIASLRYDDRGTGESSGDVANVTTDLLADDAEWLFDWLRRQPSINNRMVGIVGHSEGGTIGPMIASRNRKVAFVVMLAGPGVDGAELLRLQNRALFRASGVSDTLVEVRDRFLKGCFDITLRDDKANPDRLFSLFKALADSLSSNLGKSDRKKIGLTRYDAMQMSAQMSMPWMRRCIELNPGDYLKKLKCPVLAMNGERDLQVPANENLAAIRALIAPKLLTAKEFEGLNHLFQHCDKGLPSEYMLIEETIAPEVLETMVGWILGHFEL